MRPQHLNRPPWVLGLALLCAAILAPSQAFAACITHIATGMITNITFEDPASEAKCTAAGIDIGSEVVSSICLMAETPDSDPDPDVGVYVSYNIDVSVGDGPVKLVASGMTRDNAFGVYVNQLTDILPFNIDGIGWVGSEPVTVTGPSFLDFDDSPPVGEVAGKGMAVGLAALPGVLSDDSLPTTIDTGDWPIAKLIYVDLLDVEEGDATILIEAGITSMTVPEPGEVLMLLAGIPMLVWMTRSRARQRHKEELRSTSGPPV